MLKYEIHNTIYNWELNIQRTFYSVMASICKLMFKDFFIYFHWSMKERNIMLIQKDLICEWIISMEWYKSK